MRPISRLTNLRILTIICTLLASVLGVSKPAFALSFIVTGIIQYLNPSSINVNVQNAKVDVLVNSAFSVSSSTNGNGVFSISVNTTAVNPLIQIKVYAQDTNTNQSVQVKDTGGTVYFVTFPGVNWNSSSNLDFGTKQINTGTSNANTTVSFHIYDQIAVVARNKLITGPAFKVDAIYPGTGGTVYDSPTKKTEYLRFSANHANSREFISADSRDSRKTAKS